MTNLLAIVTISVVTNFGRVTVERPLHHMSIYDYDSPTFPRSQQVTVIERHSVKVLYKGKMEDLVLKERVLRKYKRRGKMVVQWEK